MFGHNLLLSFQILFVMFDWESFSFTHILGGIVFIHSIWLVSQLGRLFGFKKILSCLCVKNPDE